MLSYVANPNYGTSFVSHFHTSTRCSALAGARFARLHYWRSKPATASSLRPSTSMLCIFAMSLCATSHRSVSVDVACALILCALLTLFARNCSAAEIQDICPLVCAPSLQSTLLSVQAGLLSFTCARASLSLVQTPTFPTHPLPPSRARARSVRRSSSGRSQTRLCRLRTQRRHRQQLPRPSQMAMPMRSRRLVALASALQPNIPALVAPPDSRPSNRRCRTSARHQRAPRSPSVLRAPLRLVARTRPLAQRSVPSLTRRARAL